MLRPEEIFNEQFELSVLGGYKREQVDSFVDSIAADYKKLFDENAELVKKLKVCVEKIEEYQKDEQFLKAAIINAEKLNETSLRDLEKREKEIEAAAREQADIMIEKAQLEAENIVKTAQLEVSESIKTCELETAAKIAELKLAQDAEEQILNNLKKEVSDFKDMILKLYKQHLNSLSKLPEYEAKPKETKPADEPKPVDAPVTAEPQPTEEDNSEAAVEEKVADETVPIPTPAVKNASTVENQHNSTAKTEEFVIEKTTQTNNPDEDDFERNFKFKDLKFGADFDIKKEK